MYREAREVEKVSEKVATLIMVSRRHPVPVSTQEVIEAFEEIEAGLTVALEQRQKDIVRESDLIRNFLKRK